MPATVAPESGFFSNAVAEAAALPPDDSSKAPLLTEKPAAEKPVEQDRVEKPVEKTSTEKPAEKPVEKVEKPLADEKPTEKTTEEKRSNPHLSSSEKTTTEKPAESEEGEEKRPQGMTDKAYETWKSIKTEAKTFRKERDDARAEIDALKKKIEETSKISPELESLKKELADTKNRLSEYEGEISVTRVEATPQYKREVTLPQNAIVEDMTALAKRYEIEPHDLLRAIQEPDPNKRADAIEDATADLKRSDQLEVVQAARDYHRIQRVASEMKQNASSQLERLTSEAKAENDRQRDLTTKDYRSATSQAWDSLQQRIPEIRYSDGHEDWNNHLKGLFRNVESLNVHEIPVENVAAMAASHAILPEVLNVIEYYKQNESKKTAEVKAANERAEKAEKQLTDYLKNAAKAGGGSTDTSKSSSSGSGRFADIIVDKMQGS